MSLSLFQLTETLEALELAILEAEDEPQKEAIAEAYFQTEGDIAEKLDGYAALIAMAENRAAVRRQRAKELQDLAKSDGALVDRLKKTLKWYFESQNIKKFETVDHRFTLAKNGGKLPLILDSVDCDDVDERFVVTETITRIDKEAIRSALEAGEELDYARFGERGASVRIK